MKQKSSTNRMVAFFAAFSVAVLLLGVFPNGAHADEDKTADELAAEAAQLQEEVTDLDLKVVQSSTSYNDAIKRQSTIEDSIVENEAQLQELSGELDTQRQASNHAMVTMYKSKNGTSFLDLLLNADNFTELTQSVGMLNRVQEQYEDAMQKTAALEQEYQTRSVQLQQDKTDAALAVTQTEAALKTAQEAREATAAQAAEVANQEAQARAEELEAARKEAEAEAKAKAAAEEARQSAEEEEALAREKEAAQNVPDTTSADSSSNAVSSSEVDWSLSKADFVSVWTARIDAYLAGSALSGQGKAFAESAWEYGVDPRWSPAISYVESSLGAQCFLPYNAWGWGSVSWSSWPEAIDAHVGGLARGYGGTLTYSGAVKYCPPNPDHWYATCLLQMRNI